MNEEPKHSVEIPLEQLISTEFKRPGIKPGWRARFARALLAWSRRHPMLSIYAIGIIINVMHSGFNIGYNVLLIHNRHLDVHQKAVFWDVATVYNLIAYPTGAVIGLYLLRPLWRVHGRFINGDQVGVTEMSAAQKRVVDFPFIYVCLNCLAWFPGAVVFPFFVCLLGGGHNAALIWIQFIVSFVVSGLVTTVQVYFVLEEFMVRSLYPLYFRDSNPADVKGLVHKFSFPQRLTMLFMAVSLMPLLALHLVTLNFTPVEEWGFPWLVFGISAAMAGFITGVMAWGQWRWVVSHRTAMEELAQGNLKTRDLQKRPDEWGSLTDHFNEMADAIEKAEHMRETFGQVKHPAVRDAIINRYHGVEGELCEITVLFSDIRGFTQRSSGESPEKVFALLNRFLTLSVQAIEEKDGIVDKFLGDGVMALFGTPIKPLKNHADVALDSALDILARIDQLNDELIRQGEIPLKIGIGIHTGPAFVGCLGATLKTATGAITTRRDFTAIGESVNLCQRLEQLTKSLGGPILISEATRSRLIKDIKLDSLGEHNVPGLRGKLTVYRVAVR